MTRTAPSLASVAVPTEHGGWSLTLEPVLLGLLVAPSGAGALLGAAALGSFLVRSPLKVVMVDRDRHRWLPRTRLASRVALVEAAILVVMIVAAVGVTEHPFWWPAIAAVPLVAISVWHDARSRSRRLLPELTGSIGIGAVAAMIALAGGVSDEVAAGLWIVVAARVVGSIPMVRLQLRRAKSQPHRLAVSDVAQLVSVGVGWVAWTLGLVPVAAAAVITAAAVLSLLLVRIRVPAVPILGAQQIAVGLTVMLVAGLAVRSAL